MSNPYGGNPFGEPAPLIPQCPVCGGTEFDARQNQWETWRDCRKCGNRWSAGSVGAGQPNFELPENRDLVPPAGVPAPDDDLPLNQFTGAPYRKNE